MAEHPNVLLNLSNRSENVMLVREMLTGVGETVDLDSSDLYDIRTGVTEACNNVVLHAYEGAEGPLQVELLASRDIIEVTVRDEGVGIRPRIRPADEAALGIGLPLIQALVHSVEFSERRGGGTAVRMEFRASSRRALEPSGENDYPAEQLAGAVANLATTTAMTIAPASLAQAVLPRVLSVLAARAHFSTDRISDAQIVADALAAHALGSLGANRLNLIVDVSSRSLELRVGPLGPGRAERLIVDSAMDGLGGVIEKLTDDRRTVALGSAEMLALQLRDRA
jgi:serine/threonine-protein kinase RsbW